MLGEDFARIERYLRPTDQQVTTISCRVGCRPDCWRRVVRHGPGDIVAVCDEGNKKCALDEMELLVHELNMGTVYRDLCGALNVEPAVEQVTGLHQTWRMGFLKSRPGIHNPVYLSIQMEEHHLVEVALRLSSSTRTPQILLLPTMRRMGTLARNVLESHQSVWLPLDQTVKRSSEGRMTADLNLAEMLASSGQKEDAAGANPSPAETGGGIMIERREMEDGIHWFVDGVDKGKLYIRISSKRAWILDTLYEGIGRGWIPHSMFIRHLHWNEDAYFGSASGTGRMQKQLNRLRGALGVEIEFRKESGVRFDNSVIRVR